MVCLCLVFENNIVVVNAELYSFVCDDCRCHFQNEDDEAHLLARNNLSKPLQG